MGLKEAILTDRLSRDYGLRLVQSTTEQNPEQNLFQVLDKSGKVVFTGTFEDIGSNYPPKHKGPSSQ